MHGLTLENGNTAQHSYSCTTFIDFYLIWDDDVFGVIDLSNFILLLLLFFVKEGYM